MSDEQELQRELDLIRSVADRSVMDIEAAGREAIAEIDRRATAPPQQDAQAQVGPPVPPPTDLDEDDFYQFQRFR
ncbi:hypothetical protein [Mycobacteroides abscessus]|uniref:hypothetical protein n=1 Tax=Mycobacteroides abscessus TaxID=36809 RepID=UPI000447ED92|nr:hypothetical protein [Mycobacteroides abscessus]ETZ94873.1 hypothetical protein L828_2737 [Mycobacteroides abscessus MAB_030201_1061]ETZ69774.1 hypothetical protein L835_2678 [Mycobacteroides abscessus MAB_110811_1470]MBN7560213.1 hypothetical protein [Mycobacteroides abscessus subsp. abscessus]MCU8691607.1 hypothetical protein [Mycobacteroides abscessus]MCU8710816.1 hypothetical protein [Mycobacteroides abscessus]